MFGLRARRPEERVDPYLWRPVALKDGNPCTFAYLLIEEASESEVTATIYRWPRIDPEGLLQLETHGSLRAEPIRGRSRPTRKRRHVVDLKRGLHVPSRTPLATGDLVAGAPAVNDFWDAPSDLEGWHSFSPALIRITDEAKEVASSRFEPLAWTLYRDWLGQAPLIAHFARLADQQLRRYTDLPGPLSIEVRVDDDTEQFVSPDDYLSLCSPQALEKPDSVVVRAGDEKLWIRISVARRQDRERDWLSNAVLLEVGSSDPRRIEQAVAIHERMAAAVRRGEPKWGAKGSSTSVPGFRPLDHQGKPQEIPEAWRDKAQNRASRMFASILGIGGVFIGLASGLGWIPLLIVGALVGLAIGGIFTLWPGVEFTARRSERILRFALKGVIAPLVGAGAAVVLRAIVERGGS